jgi:ribose transport system substrate-binding protein
MPRIILGNRYDELQWWQEQHAANGYETMSAAVAPGISTLAFWMAQQILDGENVPHDLAAPYLRIDQKDLDTALGRAEPAGVANVDYTQDDARKTIAAHQN